MVSLRINYVQIDSRIVKVSVQNTMYYFEIMESCIINNRTYVCQIDNFRFDCVDRTERI